MSVTKGSAPSLSTSYNASTNRRSGEYADANGNIGGDLGYDIENRIVTANYGADRYAYAPGNKRVWHGNTNSSIDELTYYSVTGQKLCSYQLAIETGSGYNPPKYLRAYITASYEYFGGKLINKGSGYVGSDRLGSFGKFFPYGDERPNTTTNGTEKFATYTRDAETGLDYADQRYYQSGGGRFMTPDPFGGSADPNDPGSWNRYAYVGGDPVNRTDPSGLCWLDNINPDAVYGLAARGYSYDELCSRNVFDSDLSDPSSMDFNNFYPGFAPGRSGSDGGSFISFSGSGSTALVGVPSVASKVAGVCIANPWRCAPTVVLGNAVAAIGATVALIQTIIQNNANEQRNLNTAFKDALAECKREGKQTPQDLNKARDKMGREVESRKRHGYETIGRNNDTLGYAALKQIAKDILCP